MTDKQQAQYDRALAVVERAGLQVVGTGTTKDGRRVYAVPSRTVANLWHLVVVAYGALQCDCTAGQHGKYCCHRASARQRIELEAARLADAREQEAERAFHNAARALAKATLSQLESLCGSASATDEAMSWWLHGGEWDA